MATPGRQRKKDGVTPWRAHWKDDAGIAHNKTFETEAAAIKWEAKMREERDDRALGINTAARNTALSDWIVEWWDRHIKAKPLLTREKYSRSINNFIAPKIGALKMIDLTTPRIAQFRDELLTSGVSASDVDCSLRVLSSCLGKAVERGLVSGSNPCRDVSKPPVPPSGVTKEALSPEEVELLRREFMLYRAANSGAWTALRAATIVSVMAYAGLRPEEVMGLKLGAYDDASRTLDVVDVFAGEHRRGDTKTHDGGRVVLLNDAVVEDLRLWIDVLGANDPDAWLFPPALGEPVKRWTHKNWTARPWTRARDQVVKDNPDLKKTLGAATPQWLRGSYVSLLARAGWSEADIAEETGHSVKVLRRHYLRSIKKLRRLERLSEGEQIRLAREKVGSSEIAQAVRRELLGEAARPPTPLVTAVNA